ncbi:DUF2637 domain-containing protein [Kitasatospora sp. NPDC059327]|uniref:DUF2637 domain-containing protein n=1 Tax=Kitasatospora sp. NPDC059327 TaxID=3346803 RepID=UPI003699FE5C
MTFWDRLAVALIGAAGFALSFDALRQMAVAIHVRGPLTYVFPFTVDGFIAYGVRALLVLRAAPWPARVYAWCLFAGATGASVWANALHAVRLNQTLDHGDGLQLGDGVVGALSTLSPLALGGAVHLYILIARHAPTPPSTHSAPSDGTSIHPAPSDGTSIHPAPSDSAGPASPTTRSTGTGPSGPASADCGPPVSPDRTGGDRTGGPDVSEIDLEAGRRSSGDTVAGPDRWPAELPLAESRTADRLPEPDSARLPGSDGGPARRTGRPPGASMDQLLEISRPAVRAHGRPSRPVVERAVREADLPLGSTRLTVLMDELRKEFPDDPVREHPPVD